MSTAPPVTSSRTLALFPPQGKHYKALRLPPVPWETRPPHHRTDLCQMRTIRARNFAPTLRCHGSTPGLETFIVLSESAPKDTIMNGLEKEVILQRNCGCLSTANMPHARHVRSPLQKRLEKRL